MLMNSTNRLGPGPALNLNREKKPKYVPPKGAPDVDMIFGSKYNISLIFFHWLFDHYLENGEETPVWQYQQTSVEMTAMVWAVEYQWY